MPNSVRKRKDNIRSLTNVFFLYILTLGFYRFYWICSNWMNIYQDNDLKRWPIPRTILSFFMLFYLMFFGEQIVDIGEFCERRGIRVFRGRVFIATCFCLSFLVFFAIGLRQGHVGSMVFAHILDMMMILIIQNDLNKYWALASINIDLFAHSFTKKILLCFGDRRAPPENSVAILISWLIIYYYCKVTPSKNNGESDEKRARRVFSSLLSLPDIIQHAGLKRSNHEYNQCRDIYRMLRDDINKLPEHEKSLVMNLTAKCKLISDESKSKQALQELTTTLSNEKKVICGIFNRYNRLDFVDDE